jgi:CRISPR-associated exonuclease Cas4
MELEDFIPISALQHYSYCPRQCALIHGEQSFADNVYTARGNAVYGSVDIEGYELR